METIAVWNCFFRGSKSDRCFKLALKMLFRIVQISDRASPPYLCNQVECDCAFRRWSFRYGTLQFYYNSTAVYISCNQWAYIYSNIYTNTSLLRQFFTKKRIWDLLGKKKKTTKTVLPSCIHNLRLGRRLNVSSTLGTTTMNLVAVSNQQDF